MTVLSLYRILFGCTHPFLSDVVKKRHKNLSKSLFIKIQAFKLNYVAEDTKYLFSIAWDWTFPWFCLRSGKQEGYKYLKRLKSLNLLCSLSTTSNSLSTSSTISHAFHIRNTSLLAVLWTWSIFPFQGSCIYNYISWKCSGKVIHMHINRIL